jgi:copper transport protein
MSVCTASSLRSRRHRPLLLGAMIGLLLAVTGLAGGSLPVSAHTSFGSSNPADGAVVAEPVSEIVIGFTNVSEEAGDGFVVLDSTGQVREPTSVTTADGKTFRLAFDPALSDGRVAVRWSVRAGDAHPISGSFSFTVGATAAAASDDMSGMSAEEMAAMSASEMPDMTAEEMAAMDEFLQVDDSRPGESIARFGRIIALSAIVLAIGVLVFGATTLFGSRREIGALVTAVRVAGAALAVGATVEYLGVSRIAGDALTSAWSSSAGLAAAMRIVGGIAIAVGLAASTTLIRSARPARSLSSAVNSSSPRADVSFWGDEPIPASTSARRSVVDRDNGGFFDPGLAFAERSAGPTPTRSRVNPDDGNEPSRRRVVTARRAASSTAVADRDGAEVIPTADIDQGEMCRWRADRTSWLAFVGVAVAVVSFWFDGHTVTKGFRPLHAVANSVHVVAGSVWVGGVVAMAVVLWSRYRHSRPTDALGLVVRFSSVASVALAAVVVAGVIMAIAVLDSFGELTSTQWGQTLLLKSAAASIAIAAGAYNHFRLMPALERRPDDVELHTHVRSTVTAEAIVLGFVVVVTAWLVAAAS